MSQLASALRVLDKVRTVPSVYNQKLIVNAGDCFQSGVQILRMADREALTPEGGL